MRQYRLLRNELIAKDTYDCLLESDRDCLLHLPGQFLAVKIDGFYLRRPISICEEFMCEGKCCTRLIYKVFGAGTETLSRLQSGQVDIIDGLGRSFSLESANDKNVILLGGGVGVPPLYYLAKELGERAKSLTICLGFKTAEEAFLYQEFERLADEVLLSTDDGSLGEKAVVTELAEREFKRKDIFVYSCGPLPMLKDLKRRMDLHHIDGEFSLEERMGCGFGACMGCTHKMKTGKKRICKEGPIFSLADLNW